MKTFEEVKVDLLAANVASIELAKAMLEVDDYSNEVRKIAKMTMKNCQKIIENIDEATIITIGFNVNNLIEEIRDGYSMNEYDYYTQFDKFMDKYIFGEKDETGNLKEGAFSCIYVDKLGITKEDLQCLRNNLPTNKDFGDELRYRVNLMMGTKIPTTDEITRIESEYFKADDRTVDQALVNYLEMQRDAGWLKVGKRFEFLSDNEEYQIAKNRTLGRTRRLFFWNF